MSDIDMLAAILYVYIIVVLHGSVFIMVLVWFGMCCVQGTVK